MFFFFFGGGICRYTGKTKPFRPSPLLPGSELIAVEPESGEPLVLTNVAEDDSLLGAKRKKSPPLRLSFTAMNAFLTCPHQYRMQYILRIPSKQTGPMALGSALHEAVSEYLAHYMDTGRAELSVMQRVLGAQWERIRALYVASGVASDAEHRRSADRILESFHARHLANPGAPHLTEQEFLIAVQGVLVRGFIDRVDEEDEGARDDRALDPLERHTPDARRRGEVALGLAFHEAVAKYLARYHLNLLI